MFVASLRHNELILLCNCGNCVGLALKCILQNFTCLWVLRNIFFELWTRIQEREVKDSWWPSTCITSKEMLRDGHKLDLTWCKSVKIWHRNVAAQFRYNLQLIHDDRDELKSLGRVSRVPYKEFRMLKICKEGTIKEQILELLRVRQAFQGSKLATPHQKFFQHWACVDDEFPQIPCLDHCPLQGLGARQT